MARRCCGWCARTEALRPAAVGDYAAPPATICNEIFNLRWHKALRLGSLCMVVVEFDAAPRAAVRDVALWAKLRADAIFYLIIAAYVAFALALGQIFHQ